MQSNKLHTGRSINMLHVTLVVNILHLMTGPEGNSEFCYIAKQMGQTSKKQN